MLPGPGHQERSSNPEHSRRTDTNNPELNKPPGRIPQPLNEHEDRELKKWLLINGLYPKGFIRPITHEPRWIPRWLRSTYRCCKKRVWQREDFGLRVNFADMQRMHMRTLQYRLLDIALAIQFDPCHGFYDRYHENLGPALDDYSELHVSLLVWVQSPYQHSEVQAIKNHEYMAQFSHQLDDPFVCSGDREINEDLFYVAMRKRGKNASHLLSQAATKEVPEPGWDDLAKIASSAGRREGSRRWKSYCGLRPRSSRDEDQRTAQAITGTRGQAFRRAIWTRIGAGCVSGLFLLGPMWLLTLNAEEVFLQLGVASGCVVAFGLLMAWMLPTVETVFAATLAYAAVLMVFIGVVMQGLQK